MEPAGLSSNHAKKLRLLLVRALVTCLKGCTLVRQAAVLLRRHGFGSSRIIELVASKVCTHDAHVT